MPFEYSHERENHVRTKKAVQVDGLAFRNINSCGHK